MLENEVATHFSLLKVLLIREGLLLSEQVSHDYNELRGFVSGFDETQTQVIRSHKVLADELCHSHWQTMKVILDQHEFKFIQLLCRSGKFETREAFNSNDESHGHSDAIGDNVDIGAMPSRQLKSRNLSGSDGLNNVFKVETRYRDVTERMKSTASTHNQRNQIGMKFIGSHSCAMDFILIDTMETKEFSDGDADRYPSYEGEPTDDHPALAMDGPDPNLGQRLKDFANVYFTSLKTLILLHYKVLGDFLMIHAKTLKSFVQPENNTMSIITSSDSLTKATYVRDHDDVVQRLFSKSSDIVILLMDEHEKLLSLQSSGEFTSRLQFLMVYHVTLLASVVVHRQHLERLISDSGNILIEIGERHCEILRDIGTRDEDGEESIAASDDERFDLESGYDDEFDEDEEENADYNHNVNMV